jgi:hypothetical protein
MLSNGVFEMARSLSEDLQAVWLLQSRVSFARLEFWLILAGYDPKTRSFESRVYLVYVILFFIIWIFATLTLLASAGKSLLELLPLGGPLSSAIVVGLLGLSAFTLVQINIAARRSPFVFSEADAHLLCLTPLDRRPVAVAWLLKDWLLSAILVWSGAVVLGYALLEAQTPGDLTAADLPRYFLAGVRMLLVAIPLHLGLHSLAWSVGALRLRGKRRIPWLRWMALLVSIGLAGAWLLSGLSSGNFLPACLGLLTFPIRAGLGEVGFLPGLGLAGLWMALGMACLWRVASEMSLTRAAQETQGMEVMKTAMFMGASDLAQEMKQRQRLGAGRKPNRFLLGQGIWSLVFRNLVQVLRKWSISQLVPWVMILSLSMGILLFPEWEARAFMVLLWILAVGQRTVIPLRKDLSRWWLMNQLPFSLESLVAGDLALPLVGTGLLGWLGLIGAGMLEAALPAYIWLGFLPITIGIALSAVVDVLRQCQSSQLLAGNIPDLTFLTVVMGILLVGVSLGIAWLFVERWALPVWVWMPLVFVTLIGCDYGLVVLVRRQLRKLRSPMEI